MQICDICGKKTPVFRARVILINSDGGETLASGGEIDSCRDCLPHVLTHAMQPAAPEPRAASDDDDGTSNETPLMETRRDAAVANRYADEIARIRALDWGGPEDTVFITDFLRRAKVEANVTQQTIAGAICQSPATLSYCKSNSIVYPYLRQRIAQIFGVRVVGHNDKPEV